MQLNVVEKLLRAVANTQYSASQREAAVALSHLCHSTSHPSLLINQRLAVIVGPYLHQLILVSIPFRVLSTPRAGLRWVLLMLQH